jgi:hypothetical protein
MSVPLFHEYDDHELLSPPMRNQPSRPDVSPRTAQAVAREPWGMFVCSGKGSHELMITAFTADDIVLLREWGKLFIETLKHTALAPAASLNAKHATASTQA